MIRLTLTLLLLSGCGAALADFASIAKMAGPILKDLAEKAGETINEQGAICTEIPQPDDLEIPVIAVVCIAPTL